MHDPKQISPGTPIGTGRIRSSTRRTVVLSIGLPISTSAPAVRAQRCHVIDPSVGPYRLWISTPRLPIPAICA